MPIRDKAKPKPSAKPGGKPTPPVDVQGAIDTLVYKEGDPFAYSPTDRIRLYKKYGLTADQVLENRVDIAYRHIRERTDQLIRDINAKGLIRIIVPGNPEFDPAHEMDPNPRLDLSYEQQMKRLEEGAAYLALKKELADKTEAEKRDKFNQLREKRAQERGETANPFKARKQPEALTVTHNYTHEARPGGVRCG
jgi:hypothetical protein